MSLGLTIAREVADATWPDSSVEYLPFGVKTLKVIVKGAAKGDVLIRPRQISRITGEKFGYEDDANPPNSAFIVSWGGGEEDHCKVETTGNSQGYAYFLLHHRGQQFGTYWLTLEAKHQVTGETATLPVKLIYPDSDSPYGWTAEELMHFQWQERKRGLDGEADLILQGIYTPYYLSRWWPPNRVTYYADDNWPQPNVRLHYRRQVNGVNGQITVYASRPGEATETVIAMVEGSLGYPLYDMRQVAAELYRFGGQTWVLRLWFFWLDLDVSRQDLGQYWQREAAELEEAYWGIAGRKHGGAAEKPWPERHEIPDAERVDIVFNNRLEPICGATDFHWLEMWSDHRGHRPDDPLQWDIVNTLPSNWGALWPEIWRKVQTMDRKGLIQRALRRKLLYKPHEVVIQDLAKEGKLASGLDKVECHTPFLRNGMLSIRLLSSDVRKG